jgi:MICOS complex subunit MIC26
MFPGALWVGIVALSGSIVAQQLGPSRVRRLIYPPIWAVIAAGYFLPITTMNVFKYISELEHRYIPNAAKKQDEILAGLEKSAEQGGQKLKDLRKQFDGQLDNLADLIRSRTGLKLPEKEKKEKN